MRARHTQQRAQVLLTASNNLVNRAFHKVVNSTSTKVVNGRMQRLRFCMAQPGGSLNGTS